jgi:hypothetical protein
MSQTPTTASPSNYRTVVDGPAALEDYRKKTREDLRSHPLRARLESSQSTDAVLAVLREQILGSDQSGSGDDKLTRWLGPTVNALYTFPAAIDANAGLVSSENLTWLVLGLRSDTILQEFSPTVIIFTGIGVLLLVGVFYDSVD